MNKKFSYIALAVAIIGFVVFIGLVWTSGVEHKYPGKYDDVRAAIRAPVIPPPKKVLPPCAAPVNPNVAPPIDCLPPHLAALPPDPGEAGKATIEGIDSDKDGLRDDVQRKLEERYGHSRRAVAALRLMAMRTQNEVRLGGDVGREEAYEIASNGMAEVQCYSTTVDEKIKAERALERVVSMTANTKERFERYRAFDKHLGGRIFTLSDDPIEKLCGYDPAALPN